MIDFGFQLEPLGGPHFGGVFWPVSKEQIASIEATIGWKLPREYADFIGTVGLSRPVNPMRVRTGSGENFVPFKLFYGAPNDPTYSVVSCAADYLERVSWLVFADSDVGQFYLDSEGLVYFEHKQGRWFQVAESFSEFVTLFEIDPAYQ